MSLPGVCGGSLCTEQPPAPPSRASGSSWHCSCQARHYLTQLRLLQLQNNLNMVSYLLPSLSLQQSLVNDIRQLGFSPSSWPPFPSCPFLISSITYSFSSAYPLTLKPPHECYCFLGFCPLPGLITFLPLLSSPGFNHSRYPVSLSSKSVSDRALHFLYLTTCCSKCCLLN